LIGLEKLINYLPFVAFNFKQVILILIPTTFLFIQKLIPNIKSPERKDFWHFLIPILLFYFVADNFYTQNYSYIQFSFFVFYICFYSIFIILLLSKNGGINNYINISKFVLEWASFIFKLMLAVFFHFLLVLFIETFNVGTSLIVFFDYSFLAIISIGFIGVISKVNFQLRKSILTDDNTVLGAYDIVFNSVWNSNIEKKSILTKDINIYLSIHGNLKEYTGKIDKLALNDYVFRDKNYSIYDLSKALGLPKYYIVYLFKYHCTISFNEYKRRARIYDAIEHIQKGYLNNNTLNSLADLVGFSSYNPFLLNFKQITGISPFDFNKKVRVNGNL
jgi:AraC-like DNA-binding protein